MARIVVASLLALLLAGCVHLPRHLAAEFEAADEPECNNYAKADD